MPVNHTDRLISLIFRTKQLIRERAGKAKMEFSSYLQLMALRYVDEKKNSTMHELSDYLCVTPPSVTSLVDTLVRAKQLRRVLDKHDRRIVRLAATPSGKRALADGFKKMTAGMREVIGMLDAKERQDLERILTKIFHLYSA